MELRTRVACTSEPLRVSSSISYASLRSRCCRLWGIIMSASEIVNKVWNYAHVLRDDGVGYGDYVEQITYLIFLKMADEREQGGAPSPQSSPKGRGGSGVPKKYAWAQLVRLDGDAKRNKSSELQYCHTLLACARSAGRENLGKLGNCSVSVPDSTLPIPSMESSCVALTTYIPVGEGGMLGTIFHKACYSGSVIVRIICELLRSKYNKMGMITQRIHKGSIYDH